MIYRCTAEPCEFSFFSGYSHDDAWSWALCLQCDTRYCLPAKDRSVVRENDELVEMRRLIREPLKHRGRKKHIPLFRESYEPTGQFVVAEIISPEAPSFHWIRYNGIDELECAACKAAGQIAIDLCAGDACPRCKAGKIEREEGVIYY